MTLDAASAVAFIPIIATDRAPVAWMRTSFQAGACAVALNANISIAVAALAGLEVPTRFPAMFIGPDMSRQHPAKMARLTL